MQTDYFKLDILSPVHIGTGDELDPNELSHAS